MFKKLSDEEEPKPMETIETPESIPTANGN